MRYQYGDVLLTHGENIGAGLIQNFTHCFYNHAAMCVDNGNIVEMRVNGFYYGPNPYFKGSNSFMLIRHIHMCKAPIWKIQRTINTMQKEIHLLRKSPPRYDFFEILKQAMMILRRNNPFLREKVQYFNQVELMEMGRRLICSALIDSIYEKSGIDLFPEKEPYSTTPADLAQLALGPNPVFRIITKYNKQEYHPKNPLREQKNTNSL